MKKKLSYIKKSADICNVIKKKQYEKHEYTVILKDAMSNTERTITIEATSMINTVLSMEEIKNKYEYILEIKMVKL